MRHLILVAALVLPSGSSIAQPASPTVSRDKAAGGRLNCVANQIHQTDLGAPPRFRRLGELPPGNLMLAVVRQVDGCQQPVIVRQGYGAIAQPEPRR